MQLENHGRKGMGENGGLWEESEKQPTWKWKF
jgi:hypothetical protein